MQKHVCFNYMRLHYFTFYTIFHKVRGRHSTLPIELGTITSAGARTRMWGPAMNPMNQTTQSTFIDFDSSYLDVSYASSYLMVVGACPRSSAHPVVTGPAIKSLLTGHPAIIIRVNYNLWVQYYCTTLLGTD
jgi:hypothetical protein